MPPIRTEPVWRGRNGSLSVDPDVFVDFGEGERPHQVRLEGGDASSDSYCFPNAG